MDHTKVDTRTTSKGVLNLGESTTIHLSTMKNNILLNYVITQLYQPYHCFIITYIITKLLQLYYSDIVEAVSFTPSYPTVLSTATHSQNPVLPLTNIRQYTVKMLHIF